MLARIAEMDYIDPTTGKPIGLKYQQNGKIYRSHHFDFTPLKQSLQKYINGYNQWYDHNNWEAMEDSWMDVGKAQRNSQPMWRKNIADPNVLLTQLPLFNEGLLPRFYILQF